MKKNELDKILELHAKWLNEQDGGVEADLRGADLREADLRRADLSRTDLRWADLRMADLRRADLRGADLREADLSRTDLRLADLREADLSGADIDFSCWPLWCGSLDVKLDNRQKRQLLYHVLAVCPEYRTKELVAEANKFHRVGEVPELTINEVIK